MRNFSVYPRCIFFCIVQFTALLYSAIIRPFNEPKDNIIEIMNEAIFTILSITVTICNEKSMWFNGLEKILLYTLMINGLLISLVEIIDLLINFVRKCKEKRKIKPQKTKVDATEQLSGNKISI